MFGLPCRIRMTRAGALAPRAGTAFVFPRALKSTSAIDTSGTLNGCAAGTKPYDRPDTAAWPAAGRRILAKQHYGLETGNGTGRASRQNGDRDRIGDGDWRGGGHGTCG